MNFRLLLDPDDPIRERLKEIGIEEDQASEYQISRRNRTVNYVQCRQNDQQFFIDVKEIIFMESLGHDIIIHTKGDSYSSRERLRYFETILDNERFIRISNSTIINRDHIKKIEASIFQKFVVHLSDGTRTDVTRSYYYAFRESIGI